MDYDLMAQELERPVLQDAINWLRARGHVVERATDVPGLYYVDGGPELTTNQILGFAHHLGWAIRNRQEKPMVANEARLEFAVNGHRFHTFEDADGAHRVLSDGPKLLTRKYVSEHFGADYDAFAEAAGATYSTAQEAEVAIRNSLNG